MYQLNDLYPEDKKECYKLLQSQLKALLEGETNVIPNLSNTSALLNDGLNNINWVGFYFICKEELLLGPFQGKPACIHIPIGKGVCGTAFFCNKTLIVKDVHAFSGHIACDSASKSEIVLPLHDHHGKVIGVLDIDSPIIKRFDETDKEGLEEIVRILENGTNLTDFKIG